MAEEFSEKNYPAIRYFIGDVCELNRLKKTVAGVYVTHAAATKHV